MYVNNVGYEKRLIKKLSSSSSRNGPVVVRFVLFIYYFNSGLAGYVSVYLLFCGDMKCMLIMLFCLS